MDLQENDKSYQSLTVGALKVLGKIDNPAFHTVNTHLETIEGLAKKQLADIEDFFKNLSADGKINANEKILLKKEMDIIETEYPTLLDTAENSKKPDYLIKAYKKAYKTLNDYLYKELKIFDDFDKAIEVDREKFNETFATYYKTRNVLLALESEGEKTSLPSDINALDFLTNDNKNLTVEKPKPTLTAWQNKIIEYDVTDKEKIEMSFDEALSDVIILSGELKNDFTLQLFFDPSNLNGAKDYLVVFKLTGGHSITFTTGIENTKKTQHPINDDMYHMGCFLVVDYQGDVSHFRGEKGSGGGISNIDVANLIKREDYFFIEKNKNAHRISKVDAFKSIQQFDSPIGEIKEFYDNDYKHGFLECNGLPFSPDVFPALTEYVKRVFNTGQDDITGWQLRPTLTGSDNRKVYIKAVQGV